MEAAAEKQWEVHLRTQKILNRSEQQVTQVTTPRLTNRNRETEVISHKKSDHQENQHARERKKENVGISSGGFDHHKERITYEKRTDPTSTHNPPGKDRYRIRL